MLVRMARIAPDVSSIARALVGEGTCAVLHSSMRGGKWGRWSYVCVGGRETATIGAAQPGVSLPWFPCSVGVLPYESHRFERASWAALEDRPEPLFVAPRWLSFEAVVGIDHVLGDVLVCARDAATLADLRRRLAHAPAPRRRPVVRLVSEGAPDRHAARVRRAKELIAAGHVYQVNLARPLRLAIDDVTPAALLELSLELSRAAPTPFAAMIHFGDRAIVSTSPELLLDVAPRPRGGVVITEPIKGTRARGRDAASDRALAAELDADPKERAELAMIVDVERNDLNRIAVPGSVEVVGAPHVATFGRVHHRVASIRARLREGVSLDDVFRATLPSGSVTGAPKIRAMEVIRELEDDRRGLYTGGFGIATHGGGARLAMAIRTLEIGGDGSGVYFTGGGIVADSDPDREVEETRWKAAQLVKILAG